MKMAADDRAPPLRLICSDELGQLKVVQTADGSQLGTAALAATWGQPDKSHWIDCIDLGSSGGIADTATAVLAVARCSGAIELLSPLTGQLLGSIPAAAAGGAATGGKNAQQQQDAARIRGLHLLWSSSSDSSGSKGASQPGSSLPAVLSVTQSGTARVHAPAAAASAQQPSWEVQRSWQVPADVCCTAYDAASGRLAVGCQGAELRLFDVATGDLVFAFKGGKPNKVGLVDRPWNTAVAFLPPSTSSGDGGSSGGGAGDRLLVGTGYHKVRLYDKEAGKRPQMELSWGEGRITCLALEPSGQRCWVGNGLGQLEVLDIPSRRFSGAIRGLAGAVRALAVHPESPVLASVGLDRYLRLHCTETRQLLAKVYCKTLPTGLALCPTDASMLPAQEEQQQAQQAQGKQERRRRNRKSRGDGQDDSRPEEEEEAQQRESSKKRGKSSGSAKQKKKQRRPAQDSDGGSDSD